MTKVLIIHHLEECWSRGFGMHGTSFHNEAEKILDHLRETEYDQVILTRFEDHRLGEEHYDSGIAEYITDVQVYAYGWEHEESKQLGRKGVNWAPSGGHSEIVLLEEWMRVLKRRKAEVFLCGAFDGECIEDMEVALDAVGVSYQRLNRLIV